MRQVLRNEKKFLLNIAEFIQTSHCFEKVLIQDPHNGVHGYKVRSLYFDTVNDRDLMEKQDGVEVRRKIRLRIYNPTDEFAMLEMKQKQGNQQLKRSLVMPREDAIALTKGEYSCLLSYKESFAQECYALMQYRCYRPKTIVEYNRKAFIAKENKIRITFDHNIIATESCFDLFSTDLLMNPVMDKSAVVLEVKYNGFLLSYIKQLLDRVDKSELSVSKYYLARQQGYLTHL